MSEGETEWAEADEEMLLEEKTTRFELAVQSGDWRSFVFGTGGIKMPRYDFSHFKHPFLSF